ncbi:Na+/H+ antiporter NhaC family protein [Corynebacterium kutscheri]|uniref:Malate-2H(+)/Na(+)-lactate antiporter n=1 Tax=Corynebacterium kutscheri TaxID=35755 RepID=A0AB38VQX7_9CORY|nr:Na+/H+ antiporter NhaC family protein [Corynebacterium kutscheri]VEH04670.1 Malate-2H(+)/Na(+)-lactate antiporter [Corynebacterium kutscheri]
MIEQLPILTIVPSVAAIVLAIATRRVLLSLGIGVLLAALLINDFHPVGTIQQVWRAFAGIFWLFDEGQPNTSSIFILLFLIILGIITSLVFMTGGTEAFSDWAVRRIKTRRGAKFFAAALGVVIFIDDYFNALAVGQVAKPVTDRYKVSRAKLAYIIDSTSAPVSILAPFSSWGASIIGLMTPIVVMGGVAANGVVAFMWSAAANYYAIAAVTSVFLVIGLSWEFGSMRKEERRALAEGKTYAPGAVIPGELSEDLPVHRPGALNSLIVPFLLLVVGVLGAMFVTGYLASGSTNPIDMLAETMVADSLLYGGLIGLVASVGYFFRIARYSTELDVLVLCRGVKGGAKSMMGAIYILVLAWMLSSLVSELGTGQYLGSLTQSWGVPPHWLIPVMFIVAGLMAFSTGTSWGSFGLLIPIAGDILLSVGATEAILPALGAVLAGAVMGDHCSPISDTTILSSTGAGCEIVTHVATQLPYALVVALAALLGYTVLAATTNIILGLVVTLVLVTIFILIGSLRSERLEKLHPVALV